MICPNCGKELLEGEVCTCTAGTTVLNEPIQQENQYYQPAESVPTQQEPKYNNIYEQSAQPEQSVYGAPQQNPYDPTMQQPQYYNPAMQNIQPSTNYPDGYKPKKKYVAVILAAILGPLGIHNFYLGNKSRGIAQLLVSLIGSLFLGLGLLVTYVWSFVEMIQILMETIDADAQGFKIMTLAEEIAKAQNNDKD